MTLRRRTSVERLLESDHLWPDFQRNIWIDLGSKRSFEFSCDRSLTYLASETLILLKVVSIWIVGATNEEFHWFTFWLMVFIIFPVVISLPNPSECEKAYPDRTLRLKNHLGFGFTVSRGYTCNFLTCSCWLWKLGSLPLAFVCKNLFAQDALCLLEMDRHLDKDGSLGSK
jgi:hypothetical protein